MPGAAQLALVLGLGGGHQPQVLRCPAEGEVPQQSKPGPTDNEPLRTLSTQLSWGQLSKVGVYALCKIYE